MGWTYTIYVAGLFFAAIISVILAIFAWRRRSLPDGLPLALLMLAIGEWSAATAVETMAIEIPVKILWSKVQYLGIVSTPVLFLIFALRHTRRDQWLTRRNVIALWIIPLITLTLTWTNEWHALIWNRFTPAENNILIYGHGTWFWFSFTYLYLIVITGALTLIWTALRSRHLYRQQAAAILAGALVPLIGNIVYLFLNPIPGLDWTPATFALSGLMLTWSTLRLRLLDLVPVARDVLVENMGDGMLVLDGRNRILDINPAMQQLTGLAESSAIGQPVEQALADWPDLVTHCCGAPDIGAEITLPGAARYFEMRATALRGRQGRPLGRLVTLHEITEHKRTEEKMATINRIGLAATSGLDLQRVLQTLLEQCRQVLPVDAFYVAIYDEPSGMLYHPLFFDRGDYRTAAPRDIWSEPGLSGQVIASRKTLYLPDTLEPETAAEYQIIRTGGEPTRSYVGVPLFARDQAVGVISMQSYQPNAYTPDQIHMLETIATQAATAIENAHLFEEAQQRNRRLALINEISVAINQPIELQTVLQAAADGLTHALNVGQVGIALFDETRQHLAVMADHPAPGNTSAAGLELPIEGNLSLQRIFATRTPLAIDDAQNDPLLSNAREILARQRVCSILIAPLLVRDRVIGTIGCDATDAPRHFTPEEIELAQTVANLVALRIEQARLFEAERSARQQVQKRVNDLSGLYAITRATSRSLATEDVLAQALSSALVALGFEAGLISLADSDDPSSGLRVAAERGLPAVVLERLRTKGLEGTLSGYVHDQREILVIDDLEQEQATALQVMAVEMGMAGWRSFVGIPLLHQEQSQGALCLFARQPHPASRHDAALLSSIGHQVAAAIANARLFQATLSERSRLKALIGSSRDGIILATLDGHILITNVPALQMLRLSGQPDDWFGVALQDAISNLRESAPLAFHTALMELERIQVGDAPPTESEMEIPPRVLFWQSLPVRVGAWPMGRLFVLRDMTQERVVERMREDMTHTMVHDLRNPLSGISASLDVLTSGATGELTPRQHSMLEIAQRSARRMLNIVNAILDVSRLESGRMPLEMEAFSVHELLNEAVQAQTVLASDKDVRLECDAPATLPPAWADTRMIQRVLQNLIGNAIKFTPSGGAVRVMAKLEEKADRSAILVSIRDTGPGIPSEIAGRLFQKFVTGGQEESGSGLGLAFCRLAIEAHGERIWAESMPGEGATFTFCLAMANPPAF